MEWEKPVCRVCNKEIEKPIDAIYIAFAIQGDCYNHVSCFGKNMAAFASDAAGFIPAAGSWGVSARGAPGLAGTAAAMHAVSDIAREAAGRNRAKLQKRASSVFTYGIVAGAVFLAMGVLAIAGAKGSAVTFVAASILALIGAITLAANVIAVVRTRELETLINADAGR